VRLAAAVQRRGVEAEKCLKVRAAPAAAQVAAVSNRYPSLTIKIRVVSPFGMAPP